MAISSLYPGCFPSQAAAASDRRQLYVDFQHLRVGCASRREAALAIHAHPSQSSDPVTQAARKLHPPSQPVIWAASQAAADRLQPDRRIEIYSICASDALLVETPRPQSRELAWLVRYLGPASPAGLAAGPTGLAGRPGWPGLPSWPAWSGWPCWPSQLGCTGWHDLLARKLGWRGWPDWPCPAQLGCVAWLGRGVPSTEGLPLQNNYYGIFGTTWHIP